MSARPMVVTEYGCLSVSSDIFTDDTMSMPASTMVSAVSANVVMNNDINAAINVIVPVCNSCEDTKKIWIIIYIDVKGNYAEMTKMYILFPKSWAIITKYRIYAFSTPAAGCASRIGTPCRAVSKTSRCGSSPRCGTVRAAARSLSVHRVATPNIC